MSRRITGLLAACALLCAAVPAVAQAPVDPNRIPLPTGWQPEGIASGPGNSLYVGSIPTGAVLKLNPRTGKTTTVVPEAEGAAAIGIKVKGDRIYVAGGPTGKIFVYNRATGAQIASHQFADAETAFINDVTVVGKTAYFTNSRAPVLYRLELRRKGTETDEIALKGVPADSEFNLNGIAATKGGRALIAAHSGNGELYRIDPTTGEGTKIDVPALPNADGVLLQGRRLYVVQNRLNKVAVIRLSKDLTSGTVAGELTNPELDVPTTIARKGKRLYVVNARFGADSPADEPYWVTRVR